MTIIQEFVKTIKLEEIFKVFYKINVEVIEKPIYQEDASLLLLKKADNEKAQFNTLYIAEVSFENNIFCISKSVIHRQDSNWLSTLSAKLPDKIEINHQTYICKKFWNDFYYVPTIFPENTFFNVNYDFKLIKIKCTRLGGLYTPSKSAHRFFLVSNGIIQTDVEKKIHNYPIAYCDFDNMTFEDVLILASSYKQPLSNGSRRKLFRRLHFQNYEEMKKAYGEKVTNKLLKLE